MVGLLAVTRDTPLAILTAKLDDPGGYGRILRDAEGAIRAIREHKDATEPERLVTEINTGIMAVRGAELMRWLGQLEANNAQGELYLTDIVEKAVQESLTVGSLTVTDPYEVAGINTRVQLAELERVAQRREAERLMSQGVTLSDPAGLMCGGTCMSSKISTLT